MTLRQPLVFDFEHSELPTDSKTRHGTFLAFFGQFLFWLRGSSLQASQTLIESEESRSELGAIRREPYEHVSELPPEQRAAAMLLAQDTLDGFLERLLWSLGDEGTDAKFGRGCAYRFRVVMEIVDVESQDVIDEEVINRGGRFLGSYWGQWLNRYGKSGS